MKKVFVGKKIWAGVACILIISTGAAGSTCLQEETDNLKETTICENNPSSNLLQNPSFENDTDNDNIPDYWNTVPSSGVIYSWDSTIYHTGTHSVRIVCTGVNKGIWQQTVSVSGNTMYTFAGYCKLENVDFRGECKLKLAWRDNANNVISSFELPRHTNTIDWIYDNPHEVFVLSPANAVKAEINCYLKGSGTAWFDDIYFGLTPVGTISGRVTCSGSPVEDAHVYILGPPPGIRYEAWTDADGYYAIHNVPVASPRYILVANRSGYRDVQKGDIMVLPEGVTVDFTMYRGANFPDRELTVKFVQFGVQEESPIVRVSPNAVIDPSLYPASVQPYLKPSEYLESDDPRIVELANEILATVPPEKRTNLKEVAYAVYLWHVKNIEFDGYFNLYKYDATSGSWQTISAQAWSWGHNFTDWLYTATEILEQRRGICIEHSRFPAAILRALNIPARPVVGYGTQYWCQLPSGEGYWTYMSGVGGRGAYQSRGNLEAGFRGAPAGVHKIWRLDEHPPVHSDWYTENKCAWREVHPWGNTYEKTDEGYRQAVADMKTFEETGRLPKRQRPPPGPHYTLDYADFTLNLTNIGTQKIFRARFPIIIDTEYTQHIDQAYWTDHPECVTKTWIEEITNPPLPDTWRWFYIEFNITSLTKVKDVNPPTVKITRPKKGYLYICDREIAPLLGNTLIFGRITKKVNAEDEETGINRVEFYVDDELKSIDVQAPYHWLWDETVFGRRGLKAIAYDNTGKKATDEINVVIFNT
jgi:hypothetical protein